jgi:excreted virulence factor EspC (type VII ESX diderm)
MSGFEVAPDELRAAGARLDGLAHECATQPALRYAAKAEQAGDPLLAKALAEFQGASADAVKKLVADLDELGSRLRRGAELYEEHEHDVRWDVPAAAPARPSGGIPAALG